MDSMVEFRHIALLFRVDLLDYFIAVGSYNQLVVGLRDLSTRDIAPINVEKLLTGLLLSLDLRPLQEILVLLDCQFMLPICLV